MTTDDATPLHRSWCSCCHRTGTYRWARDFDRPGEHHEVFICTGCGSERFDHEMEFREELMERPNAHQLIAAFAGVRDVDVCITYAGTVPETVTIEGRTANYDRVLEWALEDQA